jgi:nucleotide-binding universal stress UspA family protein
MEETTPRVTEPLHHVVAATDFSDPAATGLAWAREISRAHKAALHLVHAVFQVDPGLLQGAGDHPLRSFSEEALRGASARLDEDVRRLAADGIEVTGRADFGQPSDVILRAVRDLDAELVVLATRGLGGFRHLLLGSTAETVVQKCRVPVLTVRTGRAEEAETVPGPVRRVLLPTDFSVDARNALEAAIRVFRLGEETSIHLLHVINLPPEYEVYRADGLSGMSRGLVERSIEVGESDLEHIAASFRKRGLRVETEVAEGEAASVIVARAAALGVDLVAMGTHGAGALERLFLGNVARRVVQHAGCPVLTVHHRPEASR